MVMNKKFRNSGLSLMEILIALSIISFTMLIGVPGFKMVISRIEITNELRTVTMALHSARYNSYMTCHPIKFTIEGKRIYLKENTDDGWVILRDFPVGPNVEISTNANPVFYPSGSTTPLCSVNLKNNVYSYKVTVSMAGQIKVSQLLTE